MKKKKKTLKENEKKVLIHEKIKNVKEKTRENIYKKGSFSALKKDEGKKV